LAALEAFHGGALSEELVRQGFAAVRSPGRLEVVGHEPTMVLDVAHNPHGARALAAALPEAFAYQERYVVIGVLEDKDRAGILSQLAPGAHVIATAADDPHSVPADVLAKDAATAGAASVRTEPVVAHAVDRARGVADSADLVLITGSHYSVGEARTHLVGPGPAV
jgi:dihydrofolate synthase/folylpolyglutamate synthase